MKPSHDVVSLPILWFCRPLSVMCYVTVGSVMSLAFETARKVWCSDVCNYLFVILYLNTVFVSLFYACDLYALTVVLPFQFWIQILWF